MAEANLEKAHKWYKEFVDKSRQEVNFEERNEVWLNIKKFQLLKGLNHKFLGPYASPFKMLEKKFLDTYQLELSKNLKVHPIFHVLFLKPIVHDASKPNQEYNLRPPLDLIDNEPKFKMELVLKSKQLRG